MRTAMVNALLSMVTLAVILAILMLICWSPNNAISFLGLLISGGLLVINLIAIVLSILIVVVFKISDVQQTIKYALIATVGVLVIISSIIMLNPLRRSQEHIQEHILNLTPIGMSMEDVIKIIDGKEKWKVWNIKSDGNWNSVPLDYEDFKSISIERKSIKVLIGEYRTIFVTSVIIHWKFDENLKLIDITVSKDTDSW